MALTAHEQNAAEEEQYKVLKQKLETEEQEKREKENEERVARGEKPRKSFFIFSTAAGRGISPRI